MTLIIGHRGAKGEAPENTLAGFEHLRNIGIHRVELDVRLSKDEQLVVLHDKTLDRTTYSKGTVNKLTAGELSAVDATKTFPHWSEPTGIPTLHQVLSEWPQLQAIQLEVKATHVDELKIIATKLKETIHYFGIHKRAVITSSHRGFLGISKVANPTIPHGFVAERFGYSPIGACRQLHCHYLVANYRIITDKLVAAAHEQGIEVSAWTVNNVNEARRLANLGIHSIITDLPSELHRLESLQAL